LQAEGQGKPTFTVTAKAEWILRCAAVSSCGKPYLFQIRCIEN